jgi:hypothetical protein
MFSRPDTFIPCDIYYSNTVFYEHTLVEFKYLYTQKAQQLFIVTMNDFKEQTSDRMLLNSVN